MAIRRITRELRDVRSEMPEIELTPLCEGNIYNMRAVMMGDDDSHYAGVPLCCSVDYPADYPFRPVRIRFSPVIFHPAVYPTGEWCSDMMHNWSPAMTLRHCLISLGCAIRDIDDSADANPEAVRLYESDKAAFRQRVLETAGLA